MAAEDDFVALSFGRWLVGEPLYKLDETWQRIKDEMEAHKLSTTGLKCSTGRYNPSSTGTGPVTNGAISIYTTEENIDKAGFEVIGIVQHDIHYKTKAASASGRYRYKGNKDVTLKSLYWNDGNPQFHNLIKGNRSVWKEIKDKWHFNIARSPMKLKHDEISGYWCAESDMGNLTELWHYMRELIESDRLGPVKMECPKEKRKKKGSSQPLLLLFTTQQNVENVGSALKSSGRVKSLSYIDSSRTLDNAKKKFEPESDEKPMVKIPSFEG